MRRTPIYLDPDLEVLLKLEMMRQKRPMGELIRDAVPDARAAEASASGAGAFARGRADTAGRTDDILRATGFGAGPTRRSKRRA